MGFVSIPLWFDWKPNWQWCSCVRYGFQFHFGSIGSLTMTNAALLSGVSIPLWFDWKLRKSLNKSRFRSFNSTLVRLEAVCNPDGSNFMEFQFHFGSIGSNTKSQNYCQLFVGFNSTLVRLEVDRYNKVGQFTMVSIPLWFDWKRAFKIKYICRLKFQFHFGSIGRVGIKD